MVRPLTRLRQEMTHNKGLLKLIEEIESNVKTPFRDL